MPSRLILMIAGLMGAIALNLTIDQLLKQQEELMNIRNRVQKLESLPVETEPVEPEPELELEATEVQ
jgi:hypothetical protein